MTNMTASRIEIKLTGAPIGAEVIGVDLSQDLDEETFAQIEAAYDRHTVLVFRNQPMDQDEQIAWTRQFGTLTEGFKKVTGQNPRLKPAGGVGGLDT